MSLRWGLFAIISFVMLTASSSLRAADHVLSFEKWKKMSKPNRVAYIMEFKRAYALAEADPDYQKTLYKRHASTNFPSFLEDAIAAGETNLDTAALCLVGGNVIPRPTPNSPCPPQKYNGPCANSTLNTVEGDFVEIRKISCQTLFFTDGANGAPYCVNVGISTNREDRTTPAHANSSTKLCDTASNTNALTPTGMSNYETWLTTNLDRVVTKQAYETVVSPAKQICLRDMARFRQAINGKENPDYWKSTYCDRLMPKIIAYEQRYNDLVRRPPPPQPTPKQEPPPAPENRGPVCNAAEGKYPKSDEGQEACDKAAGATKECHIDEQTECLVMVDKPCGADFLDRKICEAQYGLCASYTHAVSGKNCFTPKAKTPCVDDEGKSLVGDENIFQMRSTPSGHNFCRFALPKGKDGDLATYYMVQLVGGDETTLKKGGTAHLQVFRSNVPNGQWCRINPDINRHNKDMDLTAKVDKGFDKDDPCESPKLTVSNFESGLGEKLKIQRGSDESDNCVIETTGANKDRYKNAVDFVPGIDGSEVDFENEHWIRRGFKDKDRRGPMGLFKNMFGSDNNFRKIGGCPDRATRAMFDAMALAATDTRCYCDGTSFYGYSNKDGGAPKNAGRRAEITNLKGANQCFIKTYKVGRLESEKGKFLTDPNDSNHLIELERTKTSPKHVTQSDTTEVTCPQGNNLTAADYFQQLKGSALYNSSCTANVASNTNCATGVDPSVRDSHGTK